MTTTSTFQGLDQNARTSSRVLAPPGGGSSNIFGGADDDNQRKVRSSPQNINRGNNDIFGKGEQIAANSSPGKKHNPDNVNCGNNDIFNRESHAAPAQAKSRAPRSEFNPITGMPYEQPACKEETENQNKDDETKKQDDAAAFELAEEKPQQKKPHPGAGSGIFGGPEPASKVQASTRVSQPPGGRSTKLW